MIKTLNKVVINSEQRYSMNTIIEKDSPDDVEINSAHPLVTNALVPCSIKLKPGENFAVIQIDDQGICTSNVSIYIDDSDYNWQAGQSLKIYFYSDYGALRFGDNTTYGVVIEPKQGVSALTIEGSEFEGNNLIEVICIEKGISIGNEEQEDKFIYLIK